MHDKDSYKNFLLSDLIYFLVMALITDMNDGKNQANTIIDTWAKRNKKLIHESIKQNIKNAEERLIKEELPVELDEVDVLMSVKEMAFDSIRDGIVESTKEAIFKNIDRYHNSK